MFRRSGTAVQGRRNLSAYDRSVLALKLKPLLKAEAKAKEIERKTTYQKSEKSNLPKMDTAKELVKVAGVSHDTIHKVEKIETEKNGSGTEPPSTVTAVRNCFGSSGLSQSVTLLPGTECSRKCKVYNILYFDS